MKTWWVRTGFWLADGSWVIDDRAVAASGMQGALARGVREGRKAVVPKKRKVVEIRSRVEPIERRPVEATV